MFTAALLMQYVAHIGFLYPRSNSILASSELVLRMLFLVPASRSGRSVCARQAGPTTFVWNVASSSEGLNANAKSKAVT